MGGCPVCGVEEASISLADATAAIRTFPRRYREALAGVDDDAIRARPDADTSSMLDSAVLTREMLEVLAGALPVVLSGSEPAFPPFDVDNVSPRPRWVVNADLALAGIAAACDGLLASIDEAPLRAWDRRFTVGGTESQAIWIPRHAAHEGAHHLRDIARVRALVSP